MPTITLSKSLLEKSIGRKLPLDKLKERIAYLGTDLDKVENDEIVVEIFPNRPDLLSQQGFGRALASFIGAKVGLKSYEVKTSGEKLVIDRSVNQVRPFAACAIVKDLKMDHQKIKEIIQIQEKLHLSYGRNRNRCAIGIYPLENIQFPVTYLAKKKNDIRFQPLGEEREMSASEIVAHHQAGRTYGGLLKEFDKYPVFVDANDQILSLVPVINSHTTGKVNEETKDVFIECTGHNLYILQKCVNILVAALADMGGQVYCMDIQMNNKKLQSPDLTAEEMPVDIGYINKRLGLNLKEAEIKKLLGRMGIGFKNKKAFVPAYRADIIHPVDLIEDIAIAYGYENFEEEFPNIATLGGEDRFHSFMNKVAEVLVGLNITELSTYHLTNKMSQCTNMNHDIPLIEVKNPSTQEYNALRAWIIPSVLEVLEANKHNMYPQNVFDIGSVFKKDSSTETGISEDVRVAISLCDDKMDFTKVKQVLNYLGTAFGIMFEIEETNHNSFIKGRVGRIKLGNKKVGYIGEIAPQVLANFGLEYPVAAAELNLSEIFRELYPMS
jgi:phenylalanyl-tRNA synthetase beta chain